MNFCCRSSKSHLFRLLSTFHLHRDEIEIHTVLRMIPPSPPSLHLSFARMPRHLQTNPLIWRTRILPPSVIVPDIDTPSPPLTPSFPRSLPPSPSPSPSPPLSLSLTL